MSTGTFAPLVTLSLDPAAFAADWAHCDQVANYLAGLVAHDRADSFLYANLLSTVLNELLEVVFATHGTGGSLRCALHRAGLRDRIVFEIPVTPESQLFFERSVAAAGGEGVAELYTRSLLTAEPLTQALGFLELASDYGATLTLEPSGPGMVRLTVELTLDQGQPSPSPSPSPPLTNPFFP